jgi:acylphosphatase
MLGFVTATARATNPQTADLLAGLKGVRVRIYNTIDDMDDVVQYLNDTSRRLERDNWQQVVRLQEDGEVRVYMHGDEASVTGLAAMILGDAEAIFVSVAGTIDPAQLGQLVSSLGAGDALAALAPIPAPQ